MKKSEVPNSPSWGRAYSIKEAGRMTQVPSYILRYWESLKLFTPRYTTRGHRRYSQADLDRISKIKEMIYIKGMRAEGARKALMEESRRRKATAELPLELAAQSAASSVLSETKGILRELLQILK